MTGGKLVFLPWRLGGEEKTRGKGHVWVGKASRRNGIRQKTLKDLQKRRKKKQL